MGYTRVPLESLDSVNLELKQYLSNNKSRKVSSCSFEKPEGTSLVVQGLRLCASTGEGIGSIAGQGTKDPHYSWQWPKTNKKPKY